MKTIGMILLAFSFFSFSIHIHAKSIEAQEESVVDGNGSTIYSPTASTGFMDAGATYPKVIEVKNSSASNGSLIATFDQGKMENNRLVWPIYKSDDKGKNWTKIVDFTNDFSQYPLQMNPFLYEVERDTTYSKKGDILLAGILKPEDESKTVLAIYKSSDLGKTWSLLSIVDEGGPADYDPSPDSTTTPIWEPALYLNGNGDLSVYYSDERQKNDDILQALVMKTSTDGGKTWGALSNVVAVPNKHDRPGMLTMTQLPDNTFIASYEVVNKPSMTENFAQVYIKKSNDGINWNANDLGTPIYSSDGRTPGSSPSITWVDDGSVNGKILIASKWGINSLPGLEDNQNFYTNKNLGDGIWEREPLPVTFSSLDDSAHNTAYSQSIIMSADNKQIFQIVTVENDTSELNDVKFGSLPTRFQKYEAESAQLDNVRIVDHYDASEGEKVGDINFSNSRIKFTNVAVSEDGEYEMLIRYDNGYSQEAKHKLIINGVQQSDVVYPKTKHWGRFQWVTVKIQLGEGINTIELSHKENFAEIDCIYIH
ncbi:exo-alpha-sialidase [Jeotgalibaca ciconiae]|uniref:Glycosyl hydrolase family 31 n=1 Tax=Jeotgalibaca ciconiae TaxID=2496265 RepID=A0A3S9H880_9LACT|nr:exo-alpha-sialidase [Jeotgalibaca ciconiae]AZP03569.1 glycosyl hydrolase family 31 [Jeotgalibaca ciconiae]